MAKVVDTTYSGQFSLPIPIGRLNPTPIDTTQVWNTLAEAQEYAQNGATAWVGQLLFVKATNKYYKIENTSGDLTEFGTGGTTASIEFANKYEFPSVGESNKLYVALDTTRTYIWKDTHYVVLGIEGKEINGGGANSF